MFDRRRGESPDETWIIRGPDVLWRSGRQFVIAGRPGGPVHHLTGSAALVWAELARPSTVDGVVDRVALQAGVPARQVSADVVALVAELIAVELAVSAAGMVVGAAQVAV